MMGRIAGDCSAFSVAYFCIYCHGKCTTKMLRITTNKTLLKMHFAQISLKFHGLHIFFVGLNNNPPHLLSTSSFRGPEVGREATDGSRTCPTSLGTRIEMFRTGGSFRDQGHMGMGGGKRGVGWYMTYTLHPRVGVGVNKGR